MGRDHTLKYLQNTDEHSQDYQNIGGLGRVGRFFSTYFKKTFLVSLKYTKVPAYNSFLTITGLPSLGSS